MVNVWWFQLVPDACQSLVHFVTNPLKNHVVEPVGHLCARFDKHTIHYLDNVGSFVTVRGYVLFQKREAIYLQVRVDTSCDGHKKGGCVCLCE